MILKKINIFTCLLLSLALIIPCFAQDNSNPQKDSIVQEMLDALSGQSAETTNNNNDIAPVNPTYPLSQDLSASKYITPDDKNADASTDTPTSAASKNDIPESEIIDTLELKDVEITDVLKLLSQKSGLNIIANQNVRGKVTIFLKDVKLKDALTIILDSNNLAYKFEDGIIRVMPAKEFEDRYSYKFGGNVKTLATHLNYASVNDIVPVLTQMKSQSGKILADVKSNTLVLIDSTEKLEVMGNLIKSIDVPVKTAIFELVYAQAKTVADKLTEVLNKDTGRIRFDERSNKIVVTDTPNKIKEIADLVKAFDVKETQVLIEAKIIQVSLDKETQFGVDWEGVIKRNHNLDFKSTFKTLSATQTNSGTISVGTLDSDQYAALIQALHTMQNSTILSSPSITALNNHEAKILVGTTQPYVTSTTTTPSSGPSTTAENVNFIDVGVKLYVTPTIHQDGFITMKIRPEVSTATESLTTSNNNKIPIVDTSQAETNVTIKNGVTIIIGGLIKDQVTKSSNKIPMLGNIPIIGAAFRNSDYHPRKTEIVIFLTPRIITGDVHQEAKPSIVTKDEFKKEFAPEEEKFFR